MAHLAPRELQVLTLLAAGHEYGDVAKQLWLSLSTVKTYAGQAREQLGARNTAHAVKIAYETGLFVLDVDAAAVERQRVADELAAFAETLRKPVS